MFFVFALFFNSVFGTKSLDNNEAGRLKSSIETWTKQINSFVLPSDKVIFVGNTPRYIYNTELTEMNPNIYSVPMSGRWDKTFVQLRQRYKNQEGNQHPSILVKQYCENYIKPMNLFDINTHRIVIVDFSITGDSIARFRRLILTCKRIFRDTEYSDSEFELMDNSKYEEESAGLTFVFLSVSSPKYIKEQWSSWGTDAHTHQRGFASRKHGEKQLNGFAEIFDLIDNSNPDLDFALDNMRRSGDSKKSILERVYPEYTLSKGSEKISKNEVDVDNRVFQILHPNLETRTKIDKGVTIRNRKRIPPY